MSELKGVLKEHEFQQNLVGNMFLDPPEGNFVRINIFGEISHLTNFIEEDLYLFYEFYIPPGYKQDDENYYYKISHEQGLEKDITLKLKSISQISSAYVNPHGYSFAKPNNFSLRHISNNYKETEDEFLMTNNCLVHNLSCPFDIELLGHNDAISTFSPKLLFQINKVDYIGRHRIEGYSFVNIPIVTGYQSLSVPCYKPQEDMYLKEFSYFLGGSRKIPDLMELVRTSSLNENNAEIALNRYGIKTEYAGEICVNLNVVIQDSRLMKKSRKKIKDKKALEDVNFMQKIEEATGEKFGDVREYDRTGQIHSPSLGNFNRQGS